MVTNNAINIPTAVAGQVLQGGGIGSNYAFSTATYPSTAGTSGNVLTSDGTNWASTAPAGGAGSFVWISQNTPSAATDTQFALTGYNNFYVNYYKVTAGTNSTTFVAEISDDGGSTWKSTGYLGGVFRWNGGGTGTVFPSAYVLLTGTVGDFSSSTTNPAFGNMYINNVGTSTQTNMTYNATWPAAGGGGSTNMLTGAGACPGSLTVNRIRFRMLSGTITGTFNLYGIKTS